MEMEEEEEKEPPEPLLFTQVEEWAEEASGSLAKLTGAILPRITTSPLRAERMAQCHPLGIDIPLGNLFYPCCGSDTSNALELFHECVTAFYFADPFHPPFWGSRRRDNYHPISIPHIESVVTGPNEHRQSKDSPTRYSFRKDGLLTFIDDVRDLSVFYYRGDSYGEGGSNQRWLEPVLFHAVLGKLLDGGLIVTDGSNCGYWNEYLDRYAPWNMLCGEKPFSIPIEGTSFNYANRHFVCLRKVDSDDPNRSRSIWVWRVSSECQI